MEEPHANQIILYFRKVYSICNSTRSHLAVFIEASSFSLL